ncbi:MAG: YaaA family protein [Spirochaetota bacterium]
MLIILAHSKTQRFGGDPAPPVGLAPSFPALLDDAARLAAELSAIGESDLAKRMKASEAIARETAQRYARWGASRHEREGYPAIFAYTGEAFRGFDVGLLREDDLVYAHDHLRILSALYGVLRPLDLIMPHRLDPGDRFAPMGTRSIAEFWSERPARARSPPPRMPPGRRPR